MRRLFTIGWIPALAALAAVAATVALGSWQMSRADQKTELQEAMKVASETPPVTPADWKDAPSLFNRRLVVTGSWLREAAIYLDNRPYRGRAGFYVLMPLKLDPRGEILIVNRGWLPRDAQDRTLIPPYSTPGGKTTVEGIALADEPRLLELGSHSPGRLGGIWQNFDFDAFRAASGTSPVRLVLRQNFPQGARQGFQQTGAANADSADVGDGLVRDWPERGAALQARIDRHHGYAFQWYALAALIVFLTLFYGYRNARNARK